MWLPYSLRHTPAIPSAPRCMWGGRTRIHVRIHSTYVDVLVMLSTYARVPIPVPEPVYSRRASLSLALSYCIRIALMYPYAYAYTDVLPLLSAYTYPYTYTYPKSAGPSASVCKNKLYILPACPDAPLIPPTYPGIPRHTPEKQKPHSLPKTPACKLLAPVR